MQAFFTLFLFDIVLGFVPQATGCAVCLFAMTKQRLLTKNFLITSGIFSAIAMFVRLICNYGLIDFGFHTILIWIIFVVVAIMEKEIYQISAVSSALPAWWVANIPLSYFFAALTIFFTVASGINYFVGLWKYLDPQN